MTERLYYRDPELLVFDAVAIAHGVDDRRVILDRSAFYPTSGGQPFDTGTLNGVRVVDVIDEDERIVHVTESAVPLGAVHGVIDARRRHDHMQQHTAQHLLSALAADQYGWETASVHFGDDHSTIEFATSAIAPATLGELEVAANAAVMAAHPVTIAFEDAASAAGLRKPSGRTGEIRIISIAGLDRSACGGTHVATTAAIGAIVLLDVEKVRGHVRVGFLAGNRALGRVHAREALLAQLAQDASCAIDELAAVVPKRQGDLKELRGAVESLEREVASSRVDKLLASVAPNEDGIRRIVHRTSTDGAALLRAMAQHAATIEKLVFVAANVREFTIYMAAGPGSGINAGAVLKAALTAAGGRGGGSPSVAQGSVPDAGALESLLSTPSS